MVKYASLFILMLASNVKAQTNGARPSTKVSPASAYSQTVQRVPAQVQAQPQPQPPLVPPPPSNTVGLKPSAPATAPAVAPGTSAVKPGETDYSKLSPAQVQILAAQTTAKFCRSEVETLCKDEQAGLMQVRRCLANRQNHIKSPQCKSHVKAYMDKQVARVRSILVERCGADHKKYCPGLEGEKGKNCLIENKAKVNRSCQRWIRILFNK